MTARTRSGTATKSTRSTSSGARSSTSTTRRAPPSPRPGSTPPAAPATPAPRAWARRSTSTSCRPTSTPRNSARSSPATSPRRAIRRVVHLGLLQPRRRPARHPLRPAQGRQAAPAKGQDGKAWLLAGAPPDELDVELGLRRARAATLLMLALPGSAYLYQGEELGLQEVAGHPRRQRQDPTFFRNKGVEIGRDGCRVPLPWTGRATPSASAPTAPTCRSRTGSAATRWRRRTASRAPPWSSTARPCGSAVSCRPRRNWTGSRPATPTSCTSAVPAAGSR